MDTKTKEQLKQKLEKEKSDIEGQLKDFATKDKNLPGDWDTKFPRFDGSQTGHGGLESAADEVEEYDKLLSLEYKLELQLKEVNLALERMEKGTYGMCENCNKEIPLERLMVSPEARTCLDCEK